MNKAERHNVLIVAGEASGDLHGACLVTAMRAGNPGLSFYGIGGERMKDAGVELVAHSSEMAVVGFTEVASKLGRILDVRRRLKQSLRERRPGLVILIDYPDFNISLAKAAHREGIRVFYYISPQIWAWRKGRIRDLEKYVTRMAVILPFEKKVYGDTSLDVRFVGHPLLDVVKRTCSREEFCRRYSLRADITTVALLPGSRESEVGRLLPVMMEAAALLEKNALPRQFVLPLANTIPRAYVADILGRYRTRVTVIEEETYDAIASSDVAVVASGTATLETALLETPMVIIYRVSAFSYLVGRLFIRVDFIGLVNLIAGRKIVPELIQKDAGAEAIAREAETILSDTRRRDAMRKDLAGIRSLLGSPGAADRAAALACELLDEGTLTIPA